MRRAPRTALLALALAFAGAVGTAGAAPRGPVEWRERPEWRAFFAAESLEGTLAIHDERTGERGAYDLARARTRFVPASTFKVPHALFALDAGIVKDEFQVFRWDSTKGPFESWDHDQDLRTSMSRSVVWVYQRIARELGEARERAYLRRIGYGNADPGGGVDRFWLDGALRISALEQLEFLRRLRHNQLPFAREHQRLVKDVMIVDARRDWILRGKTGWATRAGSSDLGWFVGWLERPEGDVYFALDADMPRGGADAPRRERIVRAALRALGALPGGE